jgi:hypothetical protein
MGSIEPAPKKEREVWFRRTILWGSTPVHWKGFAVILIGVGVGLGGANLADHLGHPGVGALVFIGALVWTFAMAEAHMRPRQ